MVMKYSVVLCTLRGFGEHLAPQANVWEHPHEVLGAIAEFGYDGVDLDAEPDRIDAKLFENVADIARALGLRLPALIAAWGRGHAGEARDLTASDEAARKYAVDDAKKCVDLSASMGGPVFEICAVPGVAQEYMQSTISTADARTSFLRSVRELVDYAETRNVPMAIEPLNRFEGYEGLMNSVTDAMDVVDEIDSPSIGVLGDCFHINIEDTSMTDALTRVGRKLMHMHLADSSRAGPGTGHIDFEQMLRTLKTIDFQGYMSLDCIPHLPDWKTSLAQSIKYMKQLEQTSALIH